MDKNNKEWIPMPKLMIAVNEKGELDVIDTGEIEEGMFFSIKEEKENEDRRI